MATALVTLVEAGTTLVKPDSGGDSMTHVANILPQQEQDLPGIPMLFGGGPYSALPSHFLFGALRHPALKLREPIPLRTERSDRGISVIWDEGQEFGFSDTFTGAIADFAETVAELYLQLCAGETLSEDLIAVRDRLCHYIDVRMQ